MAARTPREPRGRPDVCLYFYGISYGRRGPGAPLCTVNKLFNTPVGARLPAAARLASSRAAGRLGPARGGGSREEPAGPPAAARGRGAPRAEVGAAGTQPGARRPLPGGLRSASLGRRKRASRLASGEIRGVLNPAAPRPGRYRFTEFSPVGSSAELKLGLRRGTRGCPPARPRGSAALRPPAGRTGPAEPRGALRSRGPRGCSVTAAPTSVPLTKDHLIQTLCGPGSACCILMGISVLLI